MPVQIESLISPCSNCNPLILGDMNAIACNNDSTCVTYPSDRRNCSFLCSLLAQKTASYPGPTAKQLVDCSNSTTYTLSRTDDTILPTNLATPRPRCRTCQLCYLSKHIPLLMTLSTSTLNIHIPILNNVPPPKSLPP